jgi:hypothetical protein
MMTRTNPKPATCDRCNSKDVAWFKSKRTGKYYLCEVFTDDEGDRVSHRGDFHSKYCGIQGAHEAEQHIRLSKTEQKPEQRDVQHEGVALAISKLETHARVLAIVDLAKSDNVTAKKVMRVWLNQGEDTNAEIMAGALGLAGTAKGDGYLADVITLSDAQVERWLKIFVAQPPTMDLMQELNWSSQISKEAERRKIS